MPKGFFTQSAVVLLSSPLSREELEQCGSVLSIARTIEPAADPWMGGPGFIVPMRPEVNGYIVVDQVNAPWPDTMGDPATERSLFGAWATGSFGPFTYPNCLSRARAMSFTWPEAVNATAAHRAFIRVKSSYVLGAKSDASILPTDYDALAELECVTAVSQAVLRAPSAVAYFNPNGEVLRSPQGLQDELRWHRDREMTPLPAWTNVRMFRLTAGWLSMDTVGMEQFDTVDHEAAFPESDFEPAEVDSFLRNASEYVRTSGAAINDGDTIDGPGAIPWVARLDRSRAPRPRDVIRWVPEGAAIPQH